MHILLLEIRKILNWKILLIVALVNVILYFFLIDFHIKVFPNGRPALDSYRIGVDMVEKYGNHMDQTELDDFKKTYKEEVLKADQFLQSRQEFKEAGIRTYSDYRKMDLEGNKVHSKLFWIARDEKALFWELQERERLIEFHYHRDEILQSEINRASPAAQKHLSELKKIRQHDLYPEVSFLNFKDIIRGIAIAVLMSAVLVASPVFIRDRIIRLTDLQYTAKTGRSIFVTKAAAGFISSLIVMTVLLAVYFSLYSLNNPSVFLNVPVNSFIGGYYWYNLTFFQYIAVTIIGIYLLGMVFTLLAMGVSAVVPTYISLIGVQVPIVLALLLFGMKYLLDFIVSIELPQWLVPGCYAVLAVIAAGSVIFMFRREKKLDIA